MAQSISYLVDIVLCIDCTASMRPVIRDVKSQALQFHSKIIARMAEKEKKIDQLRMRVIAFKDFWADADPIVAMPDFIDMASDSDSFDGFVQPLEARGGGDDPESALEALALAIHSPWQDAPQAKQRRIIVVWTDAPAHPLEKAVDAPPDNYPENMPGNLDELTDAWEAMPVSGRRLLLYAPDVEPWNEIGSTWEQTIHYPSEAGKGLEEHDMDTILEAIANSI
ncbi:MAG: vWA domain-containing protein [Pseudomonadota bacterium]